VLGGLADMRDILVNARSCPDENLRTNLLISFVGQMQQTIQAESPAKSQTTLPETDILRTIQDLVNNTLPAHVSLHTSHLQTQQLYRPSPLVLLWPRLVLLPPAVIYAVGTLYSSRASIFEMAQEVKQTTEAFVRGWLLEPMREVIKTVRAGGDEGVIVRREGITADFDVGSSFPKFVSLTDFVCLVPGTHDSGFGSR
jgi:nuclear-control-of-ATPase protein 2